MSKIEQLKSDIEKIEKGLNSPTTDERFKASLRDIVKQKKDELSALMSESKSTPEKKPTPTKKPEATKPKGEKSAKNILDDCREILKKHNKDKANANKRIADRRKQGKPATLTPSETVSKTAKSVKAKVVDMKEKKDGLPQSEVNKLSTGIVATIKSTLSGIKNNVEKHRFLNHLISEIRSLNTDLPKVAMDGGLFADGGEVSLYLTPKEYRYVVSKLDDLYGIGDSKEVNMDDLWNAYSEIPLPMLETHFNSDSEMMIALKNTFEKNGWEIEMKERGYADGGGVSEKLTKERIKAKLYKPNGDFFIEDKGDKFIIHLTPSDAAKNNVGLANMYAESVGKGYYGSAYSVNKNIEHKYADGGMIYKMAEEMTDVEYENKFRQLSEKQKSRVNSLIRLGDEPKLALATILLSKEDDGNSDTWNLYRYADGGTTTIGGTEFSNEDLSGMFAKGGGVRKNYNKEDIVILGVPRSKISDKEWMSILRMASYGNNSGTFILKDENYKDVQPQVEYEWYVNDKFERGGYNRGRAWTLDHYQHNDSESYEVPTSKRKYDDGGMTMDEYFEKKKYKYEDGGIADSNTEMLMSKIRELQHHTSEIQSLVNNNTKVEAWVVAKAERSATDLSDITHYMEGRKASEPQYKQGGGIGDIQSLIGKSVNVYSLGVAQPYLEKIVSVSVSPEKFAKRYLTIDTENGGVEQIPLEVINDFLDNQEVELRDTKGEPYVIELVDKYESGGYMAKGGTNFQYKFKKGDRVKYKDATIEATILEPITAPNERVVESYSIKFDDGKHGYAYADDLSKVMAKGGSTDSEMQELKSIIKQDYPKFVELLGENIKDPKFRSAVRQLGEKKAVKYKVIDVECKDLRPTQNEISLDKSLAFPLKSTYYAELYLKAENPIRINNNTILTCDNGKYVIDGHHRWSQVFVLNPKAKMACTDFYELKNPIKGLKATQLGISADLGYVPTQNVQDTNLLTVSEETLKKYVREKMTDEVRKVFEDNGIKNPEEHIWKNVVLLKTKNKPIKDASKRDFMPQTDLAKDFVEYTPNLSKMGMGGKTTYKDKVKAISNKFEGKKVAPSVQNDYGKIYSKSEAIDSARRIVGAMRKKEMAKKKR